MFTHPSDQPTTLPTVMVQGRALLLSLSQTENQTVWRFDLDHLIEQGFRVTGRDGFYDLSVTDLNGSEQLLARFLDKNEAHRILASIHHALSLSGSECATCCATGGYANDKSGKKVCLTTGLCRTVLGWLTFWRVVMLIALALLLFILLRPLDDVNPSTQTATSLSAPATGVPVDADQLLK